MGTGGGSGKRGVLSEINVTPLVDVMLVLLIIFMVAAGVQSVEDRRERQELDSASQARLEEAEELLAEAERLKNKHQRIDIDLPKVNNETVNLAEVKKLKLEVNADLVFRIGSTKILDCVKESPEMKRFLDANTARAEQAAALKAFEPCLQVLGDKLVDNKKIQEDKEVYLLADRSLDYGQVLAVMATIRQSGVTKFGLVAETDILGAAKSTKTPKAIP
jgi:biopolymer transport protein ExbD